MLCYFLGNNSKHHQAALDLSKRLGCRLVKVILRPNEPNLSSDGESCLLSPAEFLSCYASAAGIITDSFHGTIFSILFEKPFWTFERFHSSDPICQNSRVHNLLGNLSLGSRLVPYDTNVIETLDKKIDYPSVRVVLDRLRNRSLAFLKESLASAK